MPVQVVLVGGGEAAGTEITLPEQAQPAYAIMSAYRTRLTEGTPNTYTKTSLSVVSGTPSSGQIQLASESSIVLGDDFANTDILVLEVLKKTEVVAP